MSFSTPLLMEEWMFSFSTERINGVPACNTTTSGVKSWTLNCCCKAKAPMKGNEGEIWWKVRSSNSLKRKTCYLYLFVTFDFQKPKTSQNTIQPNFRANKFRAHITHLWNRLPSLCFWTGAPKPGTHPIGGQRSWRHHELGVSRTIGWSCPYFWDPKKRMNETPPF